METRAKDGAKLLKFGTEKIVTKKATNPKKSVGNVRVKYGARTLVKTYAKGTVLTYPKDGSADSISVKENYKDVVKAPLKSGDKVGTLDSVLRRRESGKHSAGGSREHRKGLVPVPILHLQPSNHRHWRDLCSWHLLSDSWFVDARIRKAPKIRVESKRMRFRKLLRPSRKKNPARKRKTSMTIRRIGICKVVSLSKNRCTARKRAAHRFCFFLISRYSGAGCPA